MSNAIPPSLLARLTRTRRCSLRVQEPADLGTAFGMERWLDESAAPAAAIEPSARRQPGSSWLPRWLHSGTTR